MTYAVLPFYEYNDNKTLFRGKQYLLSSLIFFIFFRKQKIDIRVASIVSSWLISGLYHNFDSRFSWWGSKVLEIVDYMVIGLNITAPFLHNQATLKEVLICMLLDSLVKLIELKRNADLSHIIRQMPHVLEIIIALKELCKIDNQSEFIFYATRNFSQMVAVVFWSLSKRTNDYWSGHEYSHLILCITDYILLFYWLDDFSPRSPSLRNNNEVWM